MLLSEFEKRKIRKQVGSFCSKSSGYKGLNPFEITYRVLDNEVWLFERRPRWDNPNELIEYSFARAFCDLDTRKWTLYWQDQNLEWHITSKLQPTRCFEKLLEHIYNDTTMHFLGC